LKAKLGKKIYSSYNACFLSKIEKIRRGSAKRKGHQREQKWQKEKGGKCGGNVLDDVRGRK